MTKANDPISPIPAQFFPDGLLSVDGSPGLSKREWFAGLAMQGLMACPEGGNDLKESEIAEASVIVADALIAALNSKANP